MNVIYTKVGERFKDWVDEQVKRRHQKHIEKGNMNILMDPEIAEAFRNS